MESLIHETQILLREKNELAEFVISREENAEALRLRSAKAILASVLYLTDKNLLYKDAFWQIIRAEMSPESIRYNIGGKSCCADSGAMGRVGRFFATIPEFEWETELEDLVETLTVLQRAYLSNGGCSNVQSEQAFS